MVTVVTVISVEVGWLQQVAGEVSERTELCEAVAGKENVARRGL